MLQPHGLQHTRLPCPSLSPRVCSDLTSVKSMISSNHLILCHPLLLLPSVFPSIRIFFSEWALHISWPKDWSFSISPSNEYSGLERMIVSKCNVSVEEETQGCPGLLCVICPSGPCSNMSCFKRPSWPPCGTGTVCFSLIYFSRTGEGTGGRDRLSQCPFHSFLVSHSRPAKTCQTRVWAAVFWS